MYIYNVTLNMDAAIVEEWLHWMKTKHIQEVLNTGKFISARLIQVLIEEEMGGITYSVQYTTDSKETLDKFYIEDEPEFHREALGLFADKMLSFRTELEVISEH